jgi:L,D-transpeptidase YcbB
MRERPVHGGSLVAVLLCTALASVSAAVLPACAEPAPVGQAVNSPLPLPPAHPVVAAIRSKLADPLLRKGANADDFAALEAFYALRAGRPVWMTEMGFSAKGQQALSEVEKAEDWGLDHLAFALPPASELPASPEAQAVAEIKLDFAILKYARFARGGRLNPREVSELFDQMSTLRDPKTVLSEIEAADSPDAYLRSLHPKHEQFVRLRQGLLKARSKDEAGAGPTANERDIRRLIINMERWRWMPEDLGAFYVWSNTPEFMLYVVKDRKTIYADKTQVGQIGHATPVLSSNMASIVFNPEWIAPPSVLVEDLLPRLRKKNYSILEKHGFSVSYQGNPVNPAKIDWGRVNIRDYTFAQKPGPHSNLGKIKFLFPNRHTVYMHDTFPARRKVYQEAIRAIGYGCVRMEKPDQFAGVLLAEDKGWPASRVKDLWDNSVNSPVALDHNIPVHLTYFTALVDGTGKVATYPDLYGLDRKVATALFGDATGFPMPPPKPKKPQEEAADASQPVRRIAAGNGIAGSMRGLLGE